MNVGLGPVALVAITSCLGGAFAGCDSTESTLDTTGGQGGSSNNMGGQGGSSGSMGTSGGPGAAGSTDGGSCVAGVVTFHMTAASGRNDDYCVATDCLGGWVTVKSMGAAALSLFQKCTTTCDECQPIACRCIPAQTMKPQGETLAWKGTYWVHSICKDAVACVASQCLPPGRYIASMCASRRTSDAGGVDSCTSDVNPTCVEVEFDYPSTTVVEGVLPL